MALFFALLYITTAYLAPETIFGDELARAHVEIAIAVIALVLAFLSGSGSSVLTWIQTWAIAGVSLAVAMSLFLVWGPGGGVGGLLQFIPNAASFFMVALSCRKKGHLQAVAALLFLAATFVILNALHATAAGGESPYVLYQMVDEATQTYISRIRGLSFLGDPNDLAQFLVSLIPFLFFFWSKGGGPRNLLLVYLPSAFLIFGMYLTHSRGGMLALVVMIMVAARKKIGLAPAAIVSGILFVGLTALGFTGGRDVTAGDDRIGAWSEGLNLIRSHPLFGIGFDRFADFYEITAHNTFVVCAAELGLIGVFFWLLLIVVTIRNAYQGTLDPAADQLRREQKDDRARSPFDPQLMPAQAPADGLALSALHRPVAAHLSFENGAAGSLLLERPATLVEQPAFNPLEITAEDTLDDAELRRLSNLVTISFAGFLTAGWFLSRAYTMCLYVNAGVAAAVYQMALARGLVKPMPVGRAVKFAGIAVVALLLAIYVIVVADHLLPH